MKKFLQNLLVISLSLGIFSCSKKVTTFNFGKPYHNQDVNNGKAEEVKLADQIIELENEQPTASTEKGFSDLKPVSIIIESPKTKSLEVSKNTTVGKEKQSFKEKAITKLIKKKIQKLEENQAINSKIKLGIIIAAIGVLFLILSILGGSIGLVFFILGLVGLLAGLLIILLAALDVI